MLLIRFFSNIVFIRCWLYDCFGKMTYPLGHRTSLGRFALLASIDDLFKSYRVAFKAGSSFEIVPKIRQARSRPEMSVV